MDIVGKETRSRIMASVPRKNTSPELAVRRLVHSLGYRFRLHGRHLPGSPDIVMPRLKKVIYVHGCFWHRHRCRKATTPASNQAFWQEKFAANRARDKRMCKELRELGWNSLVVWECQLKRLDWLRQRIERFLVEPETD